MAISKRQGYLLAVNAETARNYLDKALNVARHTHDENLIGRVAMLRRDVDKLYRDFASYDTDADE